jgi:hypothetical protein
MTAVPCPRCGETGLTWFIDERKSPLTQWSCALCKYLALEDESKETACPHCAAGAIELQDERGSYRYCIVCRSIWGGLGPEPVPRTD